MIHHRHDHPVGYASPQEAMNAPREEFVYVAGLHVGTGVEKPDFLAVVHAETSWSQANGRRPHHGDLSVNLPSPPLPGAPLVRCTL